MFSLRKSTRVANLVINDYVIRLIENNGTDLKSIKVIAEKQLPLDTIVSGRIVDELRFFNFIKNAVQEWGIKKREVRFYVPNSLLVMREVDIPNNVIPADIKAYLSMEMGKTIHLPFDNPVFDVAVQPNQPAEAASNTYKITLYTAPEDELLKYTEIFSDASLVPTIADVQSLGIYRYFVQHHDNINPIEAYLIVEINLTSIMMCVFQQHNLKLLRNQKLDVVPNDWMGTVNEYERLDWNYQGDPAKLQHGLADSYNELERILNFYRFSLNQGENGINQVIVLGDFPQLNEVSEVIATRFGLPTSILTVNSAELDKHNLGSMFIPAIGLGLKEDK